jgi:hypothetical protein
LYEDGKVCIIIRHLVNNNQYDMRAWTWSCRSA